MADIRESFPILEDASGVGTALTKSVAGDAATGKVGAAVFSFKDSTGNLVQPSLDSQGRISVTSESAGVPVKANGALPAGSNTIVDITGATITLVATKLYVRLTATVSCTIESLFQVIASDNAIETTIVEVLVGPGQYTFSWNQTGLEHQAGATGVQKLIVRGQNLQTGKLSNMRATIAAIQVP